MARAARWVWGWRVSQVGPDMSALRIMRWSMMALFALLAGLPALALPAGAWAERAVPTAHAAVPASTPETAPAVVTSAAWVQAAAGWGTTCALDSQGSIACWGSNSEGQALPPGGSYLSVSVGGEHACAVRTDAAVVCWGGNSFGQSAPLAGSFVAVSAGLGQSCAIRSSGNLACWGSYVLPEGAVPVPTPPTGTFTSISSGPRGSCGVRTGGSVECWGEDSFLTPPAGSFTSVSVGPMHACGLRSDATVACWGEGLETVSPPSGPFLSVSSGNSRACGVRPNGSVECWESLDTEESRNDGQVNTPEGPFVSVSVGGTHTCGVGSSGVVTCWGGNYHGESLSPGAAFVSISSARSSTCGLRVDGTIACWGSTIGGDESYALPATPAGTFAAVSSGDLFSCGVRTDGSSVCWGLPGQQTPQNPVASNLLTTVSVGVEHACGLRTDQTVVCWGDDFYGQSTPPAGTFVSLSSRNFYSCAVRADGSGTCWGANQTALPGPFLAVAAGRWHGCVIASGDRSALCLGSNEFGQLSPPPGPYASLAAGDYHTCGIRLDGSVACWGSNTYGESTPPTAALTAVSAGDGFTCGVLSDGRVKCWGAPWNETISPPVQAASPPTSPLVVTKTGPGSVSSSPAGIDCGSDCTVDFPKGSSVVLTATAAPGSTFAGWSGGGCSGMQLTCTVSMTQARSVSASFMLNTYLLTVAKAGSGAAAGLVVSAPAGVDCGADCGETYGHGMTVVLTASAPTGTLFTGWSGGGCSGPGSCVVSMTAARSVSASFTRVSVPPSAPSGVGWVPGDGVVVVSWSPPSRPGDAPVSGYEFSVDGGGWMPFAVQVVGARSLSGTISGLVNGRSYRVRVRAVSAAGAGVASSTVVVVPSTVPGVPSGVSVTPGDRSVAVRFTAPGTGGASITAYEYSLDGGGTWVRRTSSATSTSFTVSGLTNGRVYRVAVRAVNARGAGGGSVVVEVAPRTVPGVPTGVVVTPADRQLTVVWVAPVSDGGSPLTGFEVSTDGGRSWTSVGAGVRSQVVTGLVNGRSYAVRVRAVNAAGVGSSTSSVTGVPAVVPGAPTRVTVTPGRRSLSVRVTAGSNGGSSITAYEFSVDGGVSWVRRSSSATSFTISGLTAGVTYQVSVRAVNRVGVGPASATVTGVPRA
jgi:alpha-tubulin suppressor-like RCC1 family protein